MATLAELFPTIAKELDKVKKRVEEIDADIEKHQTETESLVQQRKDSLTDLKAERIQCARALAAFGISVPGSSNLPQPGQKTPGSGRRTKEERRVILSNLRKVGIEHIDEVCTEFHVSKDTLRKWVKEFPISDFAGPMPATRPQVGDSPQPDASHGTCASSRSMHQGEHMQTSACIDFVATWSPKSRR